MNDVSAQHEIEQGDRFTFGANWESFLATLDEDRIERARQTLNDMLDTNDLDGVRVLDAGSGSGLFSLVARQMRASVHSFDFDPQSVACTRELKRRYFPDDRDWQVEQGSVLDDSYLEQLGQWDLVYSWGVLHHTGDMWRALENAARLVADNGRLYIAIYNDQGGASKRWMWVKKTYNRRPWSRPFLLLYGLMRGWALAFLRDLLKRQPLHTWRQYKLERGMSPWHDLVDWVGGWPFEVASPEAIFRFYRDRGFRLDNLVTRNTGCNEFVFTRIGASEDTSDVRLAGS